MGRGTGIVVRPLRGILLLLLGIALIHTGTSQGQSPESGPLTTNQPVPLGTLRIRSEPSGALVTMVGEHRWKGTTPWDLNRGLRGRYQLHAHVDGYESWKRTIQVSEGENRNIEIRLTPKSPLRAAFRSAIIPGWGQFYSRESTKGGVLLAAAACAGGGLLWTNEVYQNRVDDLRDAREAYRSAPTLDEVDRLRGAFERSERRAERAYDDRQIFLMALGGAYALSIVDALFFFPSKSEGHFATLSPWGSSGPDLALTGAETGEIRVALTWQGFQGGER